MFSEGKYRLRKHYKCCVVQFVNETFSIPSLACMYCNDCCMYTLEVLCTALEFLANLNWLLNISYTVAEKGHLQFQF